MPRLMRRCGGCRSCVTSPRGGPPRKRCISTQHAARLRTTLGPWSCFARQVGGWGLCICRRVESVSALLLEFADRLTGSSLESVLPAWPRDQGFGSTLAQRGSQTKRCHVRGAHIASGVLTEKLLMHCYAAFSCAGSEHRCCAVSHGCRALCRARARAEGHTQRGARRTALCLPRRSSARVEDGIGAAWAARICAWSFISKSLCSQGLTKESLCG